MTPEARAMVTAALLELREALKEYAAKCDELLVALANIILIDTDD